MLLLMPWQGASPCYLLIKMRVIEIVHTIYAMAGNIYKMLFILIYLNNLSSININMIKFFFLVWFLLILLGHFGR